MKINPFLSDSITNSSASNNDSTKGLKNFPFDKGNAYRNQGIMWIFYAVSIANDQYNYLPAEILGVDNKGVTWLKIPVMSQREHQFFSWDGDTLKKYVTLPPDIQKQMDVFQEKRQQELLENEKKKGVKNIQTTSDPNGTKYALSNKENNTDSGFGNRYDPKGYSPSGMPTNAEQITIQKIIKQANNSYTITYTSQDNKSGQLTVNAVSRDTADVARNIARGTCAFFNDEEMLIITHKNDNDTYQATVSAISPIILQQLKQVSGHK